MRQLRLEWARLLAQGHIDTQLLPWDSSPGLLDCKHGVFSPTRCFLDGAPGHELVDTQSDCLPPASHPGKNRQLTPHPEKAWGDRCPSHIGPCGGSEGEK